MANPRKRKKPGKKEELVLGRFSKTQAGVVAGGLVFFGLFLLVWGLSMDMPARQDIMNKRNFAF